MDIYESVLLLVPAIGISIVVAAVIAATYALVACTGGRCRNC